EELSDSLDQLIASDKPYVLEVLVEKEENVFPMVPAGACVSDIRLKLTTAQKYRFLILVSDMSNTSPTAAGTLYTICVFTENTIGLLNKITILFSRRRINIESLTVSESERKGVSRFTIVIHHTSREEVEKLVRQIRKIIEVLAVF